MGEQCCVCLQQCCSSSSVVGRIGKTKGALPGRSRNFSYRDGATCRPQRTCICMHAPPSAQQSLPSFVVSWTRPTSSSQVAPPSHKSDTLRCARSPERGRQVAVYIYTSDVRALCARSRHLRNELLKNITVHICE
jgi:hypothetical protein